MKAARNGALPESLGALNLDLEPERWVPATQADLVPRPDLQPQLRPRGRQAPFSCASGRNPRRSASLRMRVAWVACLRDGTRP